MKDITISRRSLLVSAGLLALAPLAGCGGNSGSGSAAAGSDYTIGVLQLTEHSALDAANDGFVKAIKESGLKVKIDQKNAQNDQSTCKSIADKFVGDGVNLIYAAAGSTSLGAFNEAKTRAENGESVWVIGCDSDQFDDGLLSDGKTSVTMTTTMKQVGNSAYYVIGQYLDGTYPGGEYLVLDVASGALGCPEVNPNFSDETQKLVDEMTEKIASGEYVVSKDMVDVSAWN